MSLVIVRYPYKSSFEEDMLMCSPLLTNTTGEEIFNKINIFFEENNLSWNNCIDICTDGAKAMTGKTAGAVSRMKNTQALAMKQMPSNLKLVMDEAVKIILSNHDNYNPDCSHYCVKIMAANIKHCCSIQKCDGCLGVKL